MNQKTTAMAFCYYCTNRVKPRRVANTLAFVYQCNVCEMAKTSLKTWQHADRMTAELNTFFKDPTDAIIITTNRWHKQHKSSLKNLKQFVFKFSDPTTR